MVNLTEHSIVSCCCDQDYLLVHLPTNVMINTFSCSHFIVHSFYNGKTDLFLRKLSCYTLWNRII